jgi:hypothetical protein
MHWIGNRILQGFPSMPEKSRARIHTASLAAAFAIGFAVGASNRLDRWAADGDGLAAWGWGRAALGSKDRLGKCSEGLLDSLIGFCAGLT